MNKTTASSPKISGKYFLPAVLLLYLFLYIMMPDNAIDAFLKSWKILIKLLPILTTVVVLLGLFNYFFNTKQLSRYLGKDSGMRAWFIAVAGGILSHGPSYIWYPMLSELRKQGARDGLLVAFIYVRAIKLPLIPIMIDYFGWQFTIILAFYLIIAGVIQGLFVDFLRSNSL